MTHTVPGDFATIQAALNAAVAGDTINVASGTYHEKVSFPSSGNAGAGYITLQAGAAQTPVLDGTGVLGSNMVLIDSRSYVKLIGFEIRNNLNVVDGSGVRVLGSGSHIEIRGNRIHDIRGADAMGITVYGTEVASISDLIIDGNQIYDCEPAQSEALTLNGNVEMFEVTNNIVHDVNNIGIDFIGGETAIQPNTTKVARNGVCRGNQVYRARSSYGGGFAGGIYVDGGKDITLERNISTQNDLGIEIGAENAGINVTGVIVRDNLVYRNDKAGIVFGGFDASAGRVQDSFFLNNTTYQNDTLGQGFGELWIQFASNNDIRNNIFDSASQNVLLYSENGNVGNTLDHNLWFADAGAGNATFVWRGTAYGSFAAYRTGSGQDAASIFANPQLVNAAAGDLHLAASSPAINAGDPAFVAGVGEADIDGAPRVSDGRVDCGADEVSSIPTITTHPVSQTTVVGQTVTLGVVAIGTKPLSYQWHQGTSGDASPPISGASASTYKTPALTTDTSYWVRVSNAYGSADSGTATITVTSAGLLADDFEDGNASDWTFVPTQDRPVVRGSLRLTASPRQPVQAVAPFSGCTSCTVEADIEFLSGWVSLLGWYRDATHYAEVVIMGAESRLAFRYREGVQTVSEAVPFVVTRGHRYWLKVAYSGGSFQVFANGLPVMSVPVAGTPSGGVGFRVSAGSLPRGELPSIGVRRAAAEMGAIRVY
jgi:hypothetical protein